MLRLSETNEEVKVVGDQIGSPTSAVELVKIIDQLIWTENYGIFHGTCEGQCSWAAHLQKIHNQWKYEPFSLPSVPLQYSNF